MTSDGRYIGRVKTIGEGGSYGFIECDATYAEFNKDIFVSRGILGDKAEEGTEVTFLVEEKEDGKPRATDVQIDGVPQSKKGASGKGKSKGKGGDKGDKGGKGKGKGKDAPKEVPAKIVPAKEGFVPITVPPKQGHLPANPGFHIPVQVPPPAKFMPMQVPPKALMPGSVVPPPPKIGMFPGQIPIVLPMPKTPVAPGALQAMPMELYVASSKAKSSAPDPSPVPAKAAIDASMAASASAMEPTTAQAPAMPVELSAASTKKASPARPPE